MFMPLLIFIFTLLVAAISLAAYSKYRYGAVRNWEDWKAGIIIASIISLFLAALSPLANASEGNYGNNSYLNYTEVFFGLEYPIEGYSGTVSHPACDVGDNQLTSNIGINQNIQSYTMGPLSFSTDATYRHHSCAIGGDREVSDTMGINAVFRVDWY